MPRSRYLQIRLSEKDKERIRRAAAAQHLDVSTWARSVLLKTVDQIERRRGLARGV